MEQNAKFIKSLITSTKNKTISWNYLNENKALLNDLSHLQNLPSISTFQEDRCFFASYDDAYFVLISIAFENFGSLYEWMELLVIPSTFRNVQSISTENDNSYSADLVRLLNLIRRNFPNPEDIMEKFISENPPAL